MVRYGIPRLLAAGHDGKRARGAKIPKEARESGRAWNDLLVLELFKQVRDLDEIVVVGVLSDSEFVSQNIRV